MLCLQFCVVLLFITIFTTSANEINCVSAHELIDTASMKLSKLVYAAYKIEDGNSIVRLVIYNENGQYETDPLREFSNPFVDPDRYDDYNSRFFLVKPDEIYFFRYDGDFNGHTECTKYKLAFQPEQQIFKFVQEDVPIKNFLDSNEGDKRGSKEEEHLRFLGQSDNTIFNYRNCYEIFQSTETLEGICEDYKMWSIDVYQRNLTIVHHMSRCIEWQYYCLTDVGLQQNFGYRRIPLNISERAYKPLTYVKPLFHYKQFGNSLQEVRLDSVQTDAYNGVSYTSTHKLMIYFNNTNTTQEDDYRCVYAPPNTHLGAIYDGKWDFMKQEYQPISFEEAPVITTTYIPEIVTGLSCEPSSIFASLGVFVFSIVVATIITFAAISVYVIERAGSRRRKKMSKIKRIEKKRKKWWKRKRESTSVSECGMRSRNKHRDSILQFCY